MPSPARHLPPDKRGGVSQRHDTHHGVKDGDGFLVRVVAHIPVGSNARVLLLGSDDGRAGAREVDADRLPQRWGLEPDVGVVPVRRAVEEVLRARFPFDETLNPIEVAGRIDKELPPRRIDDERLLRILPRCEKR